MKLSDSLYKLRKMLTDAENLASGDLKKIFKRHFVRKPLYKKFMKFLQKI